MAEIDCARLENIKMWVQRYVNQQKFPGSSVLINHAGHEVFFHSCGHRNIEEQLPFTRDTIVRIYSMTKPITSVAIMMLVEKGLFHLDAPLSEFIPDFQNMQALVPGASRIDQVEPCATPTLHELMVHTSGFTYPFNPGVLSAEMERRDIMFNPDQPSLSSVIADMADLPLAFCPGTHWEYSVSTDILGRVIEVASGQSLETFFQSEIFEPLGMKETSFRVPPNAGDRFAALYTPLAGDGMALNAEIPKDNTLRLYDAPQDSPFQETTTYSGGGGLVGTIDDYMRFVEMLRCGGKTGAGRLLSPGTLDFMMRNHLPGDIASMGPKSFAEQPMEGVGFGLGGAVVLDPARSRMPGSEGDFSWGGMASTFFWIDRKHDVSTVLFTQLTPSSAYPARAELKALVQSAVIY